MLLRPLVYPLVSLLAVCAHVQRAAAGDSSGAKTATR